MWSYQSKDEIEWKEGREYTRTGWCNSFRFKVRIHILLFSVKSDVTSMITYGTQPATTTAHQPSRELSTFHLLVTHTLPTMPLTSHLLYNVIFDFISTFLIPSMNRRNKNYAQITHLVRCHETDIQQRHRLRGPRGNSTVKYSAFYK